MAVRKQLNVDMTKETALLKRIDKAAKQLDMDGSKFTRFALRIVVSKVERGEIKIDETEPEKSL